MCPFSGCVLLFFPLGSLFPALGPLAFTDRFPIKLSQPPLQHRTTLCDQQRLPCDSPTGLRRVRACTCPSDPDGLSVSVPLLRALLWPQSVWLSWLGVVSQTERSLVRLLVRAHAWVARSVAGQGACGRQQGNRSMFLCHVEISLPVFLPPFPSP